MIQTVIEQGPSLQDKRVLTLTEAAFLLGLSRSYLYKLTSRAAIPHYKPNGKCLYFSRDEVEAWALRNRVSTMAEAEREAVSYCQKGGAQ